MPAFESTESDPRSRLCDQNQDRKRTATGCNDSCARTRESWVWYCCWQRQRSARRQTPVGSRAMRMHLPEKTPARMFQTLWAFEKDHHYRDSELGPAAALAPVPVLVLQMEWRLTASLGPDPRN